MNNDVLLMNHSLPTYDEYDKAFDYLDTRLKQLVYAENIDTHYICAKHKYLIDSLYELSEIAFNAFKKQNKACKTLELFSFHLEDLIQVVKAAKDDGVRMEQALYKRKREVRELQAEIIILKNVVKRQGEKLQNLNRT